MENLLKANIDYQITKTSSGTWKRYLYGSGHLYSEYVSDARIGRWPLVHIASGRSPETGKWATAKGFVAIGRKAFGVIAIGQAAAGVLALGQAAVGVVAVGQLAVSVVIGLGQFSSGVAAIGQFAIGAWSYGQFHLGQNLFDLWQR